MRRNLSSALTPLMKVVGPAWSISLALPVFRLLTRPGEVVFNEVRGGATLMDQILIGAGWGIITLALGRLTLRLRRVHADDRGLLVSNYLREIHIPFGEIAAVTHVVGRRRNEVTLTFRRETALGRHALFLPAFGHSAEIVAELRERAGLASGAGVGAPAA